MGDERRSLSRRDVLRASAGGAAGLLTGLAGCSSLNPLSSSAIGRVPNDAESAFSIDVGAVMGDEGVTTLTNVYLDRQSEYDWYEGPTDYEEVLEEFDDEVGLEATQTDSLVGFSEYSDWGFVGSYYGYLFSGGWDQDDVLDAYEDQYPDADDDEYGAQVIYEPEDPDWQMALGVLGDNWYVMGMQDAVEDAIDVGRGEEDKIDQELRSGFKSTSDSPVRYVGEMGSWMTSGEVSGEDDTVDLEPLDEVDTVSGSVYKSGDTRGVENTFAAEDQNAAEDVLDVLEGYLALIESDQYTSEATEDVVGDIDLQQNGSDVVASYEKSVSDLEDLMEDTMEA
jgi:hypothetical protein